jgi:hypothetical protein
MAKAKQLFSEVRDKHPNASASELADLFMKALEENSPRPIEAQTRAAMTELARAILELDLRGNVERAMRALTPRGNA